MAVSPANMGLFCLFLLFFFFASNIFLFLDIFPLHISMILPFMASFAPNMGTFFLLRSFPPPYYGNIFALLSHFCPFLPLTPMNIGDFYEPFYPFLPISAPHGHRGRKFGPKNIIFGSSGGGFCSSLCHCGLYWLCLWLRLWLSPCYIP